MTHTIKSSKRLTRKQLIFVQNFLNGQSGTQAALAAYNTTDPNVAKVIASENLTKPYIKEAIKEALRSKGLSLETIVAQIGDLATSKVENISGDVKLKANIELLKLMGAYPTNKDRGITLSLQSRVSSLTHSEAKEELKRMQVTTEEFLSEVGSS